MPALRLQEPVQSPTALVTWRACGARLLMSLHVHCAFCLLFSGMHATRHLTALATDLERVLSACSQPLRVSLPACTAITTPMPASSETAAVPPKLSSGIGTPTTGNMPETMPPLTMT